MKRRPIFVFWTWGRYRRVRYKKDAQHLLKVWKRWYERKGWDVVGNANRGYIAQPPGFASLTLDDMVGRVHSIGMRELTEEQAALLERANQGAERRLG